MPIATKTEIELLAEANKRRFIQLSEENTCQYWRDLCHHAMCEVDKAYGRSVSKCEGTTEDTFKADMIKLSEDARFGFKLAEENKLQKEMLELVYERLMAWEEKFHKDQGRGASMQRYCDNVRCLIPALRTFLKKKWITEGDARVKCGS